MTNVFDHPWMSGLFGDDEIQNIWSAEQQLKHMIAFEAAWSRSGHIAGLWSQEAGHSAASAICEAELDISELKDGMANDGLCVPSLVKQLKAQTGSDAIHTGTTSQDVIDTTTVLCIVESLGVIGDRLDRLEIELSGLIDEFGDEPLMGRTRMQAAEPITVSHRVSSWRQAIRDHRQRVDAIRPGLSQIQIGGAVGNRSKLGSDTDRFCETVARELGLESTTCWHVRRERIADFASLLSLISGTLGKIGLDISLMAQQGLNEIKLSGGGSSSAMPHKQNPVLAELLTTLARYNATQLSGVHQALPHEQERSGAAWALEWMILPPMVITTARGLAASVQLIQSIESIGRELN